MKQMSKQNQQRNQNQRIRLFAEKNTHTRVAQI